MKRLPNFISCLRIILSIVLLFLINKPLPFAIVYFLCGISDVLDGCIARSTGAETPLGVKLDSLGDIVFYAAWLFILVTLLNDESSGIILACAIAACVVRIANVVITKVKFKQFGIMHTVGNKLTGLVLFIILPVCIFIGSMPVWIVISCSIVAVLFALEESVILLKSDIYDANRRSIFLHLERRHKPAKVKKRKRTLKTIGVILTVIVIGVGGFIAFSAYQINQIPKMTFDDMLAYTTNDNEGAIITVGIIQNGEAVYTVYGENGTILPQAEYVYELGSVTKTFTASLLFKAIDEGKISLDDSIDKYLDLPQKDYYPTIKRLITHTSGYKGQYYAPAMASNFLGGENIFYGISTDSLVERIGKINLQDRDYGYMYSNFGISVVGAVLSKLYNEDYAALMNAYIKEDLGLGNTKISDGSGDLKNYEDWANDDAYMPAGALTSTVGDALKYAKIQMEGQPEYLADMHEAITVIDANTKTYEKMNIRMDSIGAAWVIDNVNNIVWHNGGTNDYNCYLGIDLDRQIAVAVLSNLPPGYRIPTTVMGVKLLTDLQKDNNLGRQ